MFRRRQPWQRKPLRKAEENMCQQECPKGDRGHLRVRVILKIKVEDYFTCICPFCLLAGQIVLHIKVDRIVNRAP